MAKMFPPGQFDRQLRQALWFLCYALPKGNCNMDALESEARRVFERVIQDYREDEGQLRGITE